MAPLIMVVDDALFSRLRIRDILYEAGFRLVVEAETGKEALKTYDRWKRDMVIMDIHMTEMSGLDAAREILASDPRPRSSSAAPWGEQIIVKEAHRLRRQGFHHQAGKPEEGPGSG